MGNIYENGYDKLLSRQQDEGVSDFGVSDPTASLGNYQGGLSNQTEDVISTQAITSGATAAVSWYGKTTFTDTIVGKREGVDNDGTYKWIIGSGTSSVDWNVTTADTLTVKGTITATTGIIGGWTINATTLTGGNATLDSAGSLSVGTGDNIFKADSNGIYLGNAVFASAPFRVSMAGALISTSATITGAITATSGTIGSFTIGTYLYTGSKTAYNDANAGVHIGGDGIGFGNNVFTVSAAGVVVATSLTLTGGTIKHGKTSFTDSANAGYYIGSEGIYFGAATDTSKLKYAIGDGSFDFIGTISSRSTLTIANTIDSSGNVLTDITNARLNSSAKTILSDFNFGTTDYAGAVKSGDITWNTATGAITGGSGVVVYRGGIVGAAAGVATFSINAATGAADFAGNLSAPTGNIGGCTLASNSITAGSAKVLHTCDAFNQNGTWSVVYDAQGIRTEYTTIFQGAGAIAFNINVALSGEHYAEISNTTITSTNLSAYQGTGKFRAFVYLPSITYITELNLNWGSSGSDGWWQVVTTQSNGQPFAIGWNELEFVWANGQSFGTPDASAITYCAFRVTYAAEQTNMNGVCLDFIACYSGAGALRTYTLGTYGGLILDDFGLRGYDANNNPSFYTNALTGDIYAKRGVFENVIVKAKAGSNIWPTLSIVGYFSGMDKIDYATHQVALNTTESVNADLAVLGFTIPTGVCRVGRWKQLSSTATSAISLYNSHAGGFTLGAVTLNGCIKIGAYFYISFLDAGASKLNRLTEDCVTVAGMTLAGGDYNGSLAYDNASGYLCVLTNATQIRRYTISGTTATYHSLITLNTPVTIRTLVFMYDGTCYYGYDAANGLLRKFNSAGVQQSTLSIGETNAGLFKGLVKIQGVLYLICESPEIMANNGYVKQQYILNLIPINNF